MIYYTVSRTKHEFEESEKLCQTKGRHLKNFYKKIIIARPITAASAFAFYCFCFFVFLNNFDDLIIPEFSKETR